MIPRIEQKLEFNKAQYIDFLKWLKYKKANILYPERIICSRYLDNKNMSIFNDTVEGLIPRKKIRIRTYGNVNFTQSISSYALEIKITNAKQRMKSIVKNIDHNKILENGYYDKYYGVCFAKVDISYSREYYKFDNIRITIDKNIKYKNINLNNKNPFLEFNENNFVLEIKADIKQNLTDLSNIFDFPRTRFSKYERAVDSILNQ